MLLVISLTHVSSAKLISNTGLLFGKVVRWQIFCLYHCLFLNKDCKNFPDWSTLAKVIAENKYCTTFVADTGIYQIPVDVGLCLRFGGFAVDVVQCALDKFTFLLTGSRCGCELCCLELSWHSC